MERKHLLPYHILYQDESDEMETSHRKPTGFPNHQEQEEMERDDDQLDECRKQIGNHTSSIYHTTILWTKIVFHKLNQSYYTRTKLFHTQILFSVTAAKIDIFLQKQKKKIPKRQGEIPKKRKSTSTMKMKVLLY